MSIRAIIFGGIGSLVETSELQRQAFNDAFRELGVDWHWDQDTYRGLLSITGGQNRIRHYATRDDTDIELSGDKVAAIHKRKSELFQRALAEKRPAARSGVRNLINRAKGAGVRVAIASATSENNIRTLLEHSDLEAAAFDVIMHRGRIDKPKPDPEVYKICLEELGVDAVDSIAIEDSESGIDAARAAGVACIALPGANTETHDFSRASVVLSGEDTPEASRATDGLDGLDLDTCASLAASTR